MFEFGFVVQNLEHHSRKHNPSLFYNSRGKKLKATFPWTFLGKNYSHWTIIKSSNTLVYSLPLPSSAVQSYQNIDLHVQGDTFTMIGSRKKINKKKIKRPLSITTALCKDTTTQISPLFDLGCDQVLFFIHHYVTDDEQFDFVYNSNGKMNYTGMVCGCGDYYCVYSSVTMHIIDTNYCYEVISQTVKNGEYWFECSEPNWSCIHFLPFANQKAALVGIQTIVIWIGLPTVLAPIILNYLETVPTVIALQKI